MAIALWDAHNGRLMRLRFEDRCQESTYLLLSPNPCLRAKHPRFPALKAWFIDSRPHLLVHECTVRFLTMVCLSRLVTTEIGLWIHLRLFLSVSSGCPARARAGHLVASAEEANFPRVICSSSPSSTVSPFTATHGPGLAATPDLL